MKHTVLTEKTNRKTQLSMLKEWKVPGLRGKIRIDPKESFIG